MVAKLSVIVPVYNVEKYLATCLDSLLNQTLKDIDIICIDDGSTDSSPKILKKYAKQDKRIKILTQKNAGQSAARNAGLKFAKTEFIAFADSDDTLVSTAYETALSKMTNNIDLVHFGTQTICGTDKQMQKKDDDYFRIKYSGCHTINEKLIQSVDVSPCNKIFRKSIIDKYNISFPVGLRYEDAYFCNIYAINSKKCFFIPDKLYMYLRHEGSTMAKTFINTSSQSIEHLKIAIKIYEYLSEHNLYKLWQHHFAYLFLF